MRRWADRWPRRKRTECCRWHVGRPFHPARQQCYASRLITAPILRTPTDRKMDFSRLMGQLGGGGGGGAQAPAGDVPTNDNVS